jgi:hypothetical protein
MGTERTMARKKSPNNNAESPNIGSIGPQETENPPETPPVTSKASQNSSGASSGGPKIASPEDVKPAKRGNQVKRNVAQRELNKLEVVRLLRRGWSLKNIADHMGISEKTARNDFATVVAEIRKNYDDPELEDKIALVLHQYEELKKEAWQAWENSKRPYIRDSVEVYASVKPPEIDEDGNPVPDEADVIGGLGGQGNGAGGAGKAQPIPSKANGKAGRGIKVEEVKVMDGVESVQARLSPSAARKVKALGAIPAYEDVIVSRKPTLDRIKRVRTKEKRLPANEFLKTIMGCLEAERTLQGLDPAKEIKLDGNVTWDIFATNLTVDTSDAVEAALAARMANGGLPPSSNALPPVAYNGTIEEIPEGPVVEEEPDGEPLEPSELIDPDTDDEEYEDEDEGVGEPEPVDPDEAEENRSGVPVSTGGGVKGGKLADTNRVQKPQSTPNEAENTPVEGEKPSKKRRKRP